MTKSGTSENTCVVVLGMGRSGTSAFTGLLDIMGVHVGHSLLPANFVNPSGYWEHKEVVELNDQLLGSFGFAWDDIRRLPDCWLQDERVIFIREKLIAILRQDFERTPLWALKDPRICCLLPLWIDILEEIGCATRFVIVLRHPAEIAESLLARDGTEIEHSHLVWLQYIHSAILHTERTPRVFVTFDDLILDWRACLIRVSHGLRIKWPHPYADAERQVCKFIDPKLKHYSLSSNKCAGMEWPNTVYNALQSACAEENHELRAIMKLVADALDRLHVKIGSQHSASKRGARLDGRSSDVSEAFLDLSASLSLRKDRSR